jgi:hypothetical protein
MKKNTSHTFTLSLIALVHVLLVHTSLTDTVQSGSNPTISSGGGTGLFIDSLLKVERERSPHIWTILSM